MQMTLFLPRAELTSPQKIVDFDEKHTLFSRYHYE